MMVVSYLKTYFIIGVCHQKSRGSSGAKNLGRRNSGEDQRP